MGKTKAMGWDPVQLLQFNTDADSHIQISNSKTCRQRCDNKPCTYICPSEVYNWDFEAAALDIQYDRCVECGACKVVCPHDNVDWHYPRGGYGVAYRF